MDEERKAKWGMFVGGHWTKTPPSRPGKYMVADRDGCIVSNPIVVIEYDGSLKAIWHGGLMDVPERTWQGWWWSEPLGDLPKPGDWGPRQ